MLFESGENVVLDFRLVCPGAPCGQVEGDLDVTLDNGDTTHFEATTEDDHLSFDLPDALSKSTAFSYHADFAFADGSRATYPADSGSVAAISIDDASPVDLGVAAFDEASQELGKQVVTGSWGAGPGQFGMNEQLSGPSSFDIDPTTGDIVVLDQVNSRLVRINPAGETETHDLKLRAGVPDLAVESDGTLDVLYANVVAGGVLQQFAPTGGQPLREIALATESANTIRRIGATVFVEGDDSYWLPVSQDGKILSPDEQVANSSPGLTDGEHLVVRKHLGDLGNEVRVAETGPSGTSAWRLTGKTALGAVLVAAPLTDGRVAVVQTQFDEHHAQYAVLTLGADGVQSFATPRSLYAGIYDPSEFRLDGDLLYQARSTKDGFSVWRYDLSGGSR